MLRLILSYLSFFVILFSAGFFYSDTESNTENPTVEIEELVLSMNDSTLTYGYNLFTRTNLLIGPNVKDVTKRFTGNILQCSTCHLNAGTKPFAMPLIGVTGRFPQYRGRENQIGTITDRVNGCFERSMNGAPMDSSQYEMKALLKYISWLDTVPRNDKDLIGKGLKAIEIPNRAVDLVKGEEVYKMYCTTCHQDDGEGMIVSASEKYIYPPLWGENSYNNGAGMTRVITAAQFIKYNMPNGISYKYPILTDEEAYDVAGYINQKIRPTKDNLESDFPDRLKKPVSTPYPPYFDSFPQSQHQLGPFQPIMEYYKQNHNIEKTK